MTLHRSTAAAVFLLSLAVLFVMVRSTAKEYRQLRTEILAAAAVTKAWVDPAKRPPPNPAVAADYDRWTESVLRGMHTPPGAERASLGSLIDGGPWALAAAPLVAALHDLGRRGDVEAYNATVRRFEGSRDAALAAETVRRAVQSRPAAPPGIGLLPEPLRSGAAIVLSGILLALHVSGLLLILSLTVRSFTRFLLAWQMIGFQPLWSTHAPR